MAFKSYNVVDIGQIKVYKRRGVRNIRLSISGTGEARVTLPYWTPYKVGVEFARSKAQWIQEQKPTQLGLINGTRIGKTHVLEVQIGTNEIPRTSIREGKITVRLPARANLDDNAIQERIRRASLRALKAESHRFLPPRLEALATQHGFTYSSVRIKQLKGRWGSCNHKKEITLNCYLMQLSWELIDYVLLHELVHTRIMAHGTPFWAELVKYMPNLTAARKAIRQHQPVLKNTQDS